MRRNKKYLVKAHVSKNGCFGGCGNASVESLALFVGCGMHGCFGGCGYASVESLALFVESGMLGSMRRVTKSSINDQAQNLDLSCPRDVLAHKIESLVETRSRDLHVRHVSEYLQAEEVVDTSPSVAGRSVCSKGNHVRCRSWTPPRLTRFGDEAAKVAMQNLAQAGSPDKLKY